MDKDKTMTKNSRACGRVQGMLGGGGIDGQDAISVQEALKSSLKKMEWDQPLEALKGDLRC